MGGRNAVYGGQIVGQALMSAFQSIQDLDSSFRLHSVHCYFVGPNKYEQDICYKVQRIKEGRSFCSLTVDGTQGDNVITSKFMVSFDKPEPGPNSNLFDFASREMPSVPHPDSLNLRGDTMESDEEGINLFHFSKYFFEYFGAMSSFPGLNIYMCLTVREMEDFASGRPVSTK